MELKDHQKKAIEKARKIMAKHNLAYIFGLPRVGKSLIALGVFKDKNRVLVLTKKNAIEGWLKYKSIFKNYDVINYEKIIKLDPSFYDAVVIDEAHNFSTIPKPSLRMKNTRSFCKNKPLLYLSGTPLVETALSIYAQFSISSFNPFKEVNFYKFFKNWGIPSPIYFNGRNTESYTKYKEELLDFIEPYIVRVTYKDAGFEYRNEDQLIEIKAPTPWYNIFKGIRNNNFLGEYPLESSSAVYQALHQFEGGTYKGKIFKLKPKVEWLIDFANKNKDKSIAVMSYFVNEQNYLKSLNLKNVEVFSSTKNCEGVDLSHFDKFVLFSFGYSGSKFIQLRDRIVNITKDKTTYCIIPVIKDGLAKEVYKCVSDKKDFNSKIFEKLF